MHAIVQNFTIAFVLLVHLIVPRSVQALEADSKGIKLGGSRLHTKLSIDYFKTDNVFATNTNEIESTGFKISPSINWKGGHAATDYFILFDSVYTKYNDIEGEKDDTSDHTLKMGSTLGISSRSRLDLGFSDSNTHEDFTLAVQDESIPDETQQSLTPEASVFGRRRYSTQFTYGAKKAKGNLALGLIHSEVDFENTNLDGDDTGYSYVTFEPEISLSLLLSPATRIIFGVSNALIDYDRSNTGKSLDSNESSIFTGFSWDITSKTGGSFRLGKTSRDYKSDELPDADTTALALNAFWSPRSYTKLRVSARRGFSKGNKVNEVYTTARILLSQEWSKRFSSEFSAKWQRNERAEFQIDDISTPSSDRTFTQFGADLYYIITKRISMNLGAWRTVQPNQASNLYTEIVTDGDRRITQIHVNLEYNLLKWLNFSVSAKQATASSEIDELEFIQNWYSFGLTGTL